MDIRHYLLCVQLPIVTDCLLLQGFATIRRAKQRRCLTSRHQQYSSRREGAAGDIHCQGTRPLTHSVTHKHNSDSSLSKITQLAHTNRHVSLLPRGCIGWLIESCYDVTAICHHWGYTQSRKSLNLCSAELKDLSHPV